MQIHEKGFGLILDTKLVTLLQAFSGAPQRILLKFSGFRDISETITGRRRILNLKYNLTLTAKTP